MQQLIHARPANLQSASQLEQQRVRCWPKKRAVVGIDNVCPNTAQAKRTVCTFLAPKRGNFLGGQNANEKRIQFIEPIFNPLPGSIEHLNGTCRFSNRFEILHNAEQ